MVRGTDTPQRPEDRGKPRQGARHERVPFRGTRRRGGGDVDRPINRAAYFAQSRVLCCTSTRSRHPPRPRGAFVPFHRTTRCSPSPTIIPGQGSDRRWRCVRRASGCYGAPFAALCGLAVRLRALPCVKVDHDRLRGRAVQALTTKRTPHGVFTDTRVRGHAEHAHGPARAGECLEFQGVQCVSHGANDTLPSFSPDVPIPDVQNDPRDGCTRPRIPVHLSSVARSPCAARTFAYTTRLATRLSVCVLPPLARQSFSVDGSRNHWEFQ